MTIGLYKTILLPYMNAPRPTAPNSMEPRSAAGLGNTAGRNGGQRRLGRRPSVGIRVGRRISGESKPCKPAFAGEPDPENEYHGAKPDSNEPASHVR